jgi:putative transposase
LELSGFAAQWLMRQNRIIISLTNADAIQRFLQREAKFEIYGYVILENHLHLIAASADLGRDMQRFKSYTAKRIIDYLEQSQAKRVLELLALFKRAHKTESQYQVWEEGSHSQLLESETVMRQKLDYIHQNPVKHGYVDLPDIGAIHVHATILGQEGS